MKEFILKVGDCMPCIIEYGIKSFIEAFGPREIKNYKEITEQKHAEWLFWFD